MCLWVFLWVNASIKNCPAIKVAAYIEGSKCIAYLHAADSRVSTLAFLTLACLPVTMSVVSISSSTKPSDLATLSSLHQGDQEGLYSKFADRYQH